VAARKAGEQQVTGSAGPLSLPQIEAQALAVLERASDAKVIAIQARTQAAWPDAINLSGRPFRLRWCESPLMAREALSALEDVPDEQAGPGLILLTPLSARDLGGDVVARLARAQVFQPDAWGMVQQLFKAREIDARLGRFRWMAQLLVERASMGAYPPVPNGFLDMDTAWRHILGRCLSLEASKPDAAMLLNWSLGADSAGHFDDLPDQAKAADRRLAGRFGRSGRRARHALRNGRQHAGCRPARTGVRRGVVRSGRRRA
jgi:hypothetical protein